MNSYLFGADQRKQGRKEFDQLILEMLRSSIGCVGDVEELTWLLWKIVFSVAKRGNEKRSGLGQQEGLYSGTSVIVEILEGHFSHFMTHEQLCA
ncbi:hypothetical protein CsSME_00050660 [Camellia sinensis var. sinensis]